MVFPLISPLLTIVVCLVLAYISSEIGRLINLPRVVGQIVAGLFLGIGIIYSLHL